MRTFEENIIEGALRRPNWRLKLSFLFHPGGQLSPPMPFVYRWRWRISRALLHGVKWVWTHELRRES
jgi:hypothetical protein